MKKTYLVMTDPEKGAVEGNWTIMDPRQFALFLRTEEGQRRKDRFERIGAIDDEAGVIYMECDPEKQKEIWCERNHADYLRRQKAESGYVEISLDEVSGPDGEEDACSLHELIADEKADTADTAFRVAIRQELPAALEELDGMERELILSLACDGDMTVTRYARERGTSRKCIRKRQASAIRKLRLHFRRKRLM